MRHVGYIAQPAFADLARLIPASLTLGPGGSVMVPLDADKLRVARAIVQGTGTDADGDWEAARFVALGQSRQIVAHVDLPALRGQRFHIPLAANDGCWSFYAGTWSQLAEGAIYWMNPTTLHGAVNWGQSTRVHLMIDTMR